MILLLTLLGASAAEIDPLLGEPYEATKEGQPTPGGKYWDLEVLYHQQKHLEGAKLAEERYAQTRDPHLTLHIARFWHQYLEGNETMSKKEREAIYTRNLGLLDEGIAADPSDAHMKFARGVVMARLGTSRGVLASLGMAKDIEQAWLDTVASPYRYHAIGEEEQLPCDAYLALGIYYRMIPDSWLVNMIAGVRGSLDKSLEMHEKSVACSGPRIRSLKELAVTQLCKGTTNKDPVMLAAGVATINRYLTLKPSMEADIIDLKHAGRLLGDPNLACGYSRDGQQDLDEKQLQK